MFSLEHIVSLIKALLIRYIALFFHRKSSNSGEYFNFILHRNWDA